MRPHLYARLWMCCCIKAPSSPYLDYTTQFVDNVTGEVYDTEYSLFMYVPNPMKHLTLNRAIKQLWKKRPIALVGGVVIDECSSQC